MPVGRGRVLVNALNLECRTTGSQTDNPARRWLLNRCLCWLALDADFDAQLAADNAQALSAELNRGELDLSTVDWRFAVDADHSGEKQGWDKAEFDDSQWATIRIGQAWEAQGYESLDGWAWYRLNLRVPEEMAHSEKLFLNFTGADDYYRLFVNGHFVGTGGDIETKTTAFDEHKSHDITSSVDRNGPNEISIAVYDWYGAGGLFRPIFLSSQPISDQPPMLK